jgi:hypothetical protein
VLYALAKRVIASNKIITSFFRRLLDVLPFQSPFQPLERDEPLVHQMWKQRLSPRTERCISVTSSGRSSTSKTIKYSIQDDLQISHERRAAS